MARIDNDGKVVDDGCFKDLDDLVFRPNKYPEPCPNHVCPNCGYCPTCGRRSWPYRYPHYEPIWLVTNNSYTYC